MLGRSEEACGLTNFFRIEMGLFGNGFRCVLGIGNFPGVLIEAYCMSVNKFMVNQVFRDNDMSHSTKEEHVRAALNGQENIGNTTCFRLAGVNANNLGTLFLSPYNTTRYKGMRGSCIVAHVEDDFRIFEFRHAVRHSAFT